MEAKDTVMSDKEIIGKIIVVNKHAKGREALRIAVQAQGEISFNAGIKEVVEWYESMLYDAFVERDLVALITDGSSEKCREHLIKYIVEKKEAKYKEWGIKKSIRK